MKRDPLKATVLATRYIPNATQKKVQDLITAGFLKKEQRWRENGGRSSLLFTLTDCN